MVGVMWTFDVRPFGQPFQSLILFQFKFLFKNFKLFFEFNLINFEFIWHLSLPLAWFKFRVKFDGLLSLLIYFVFPSLLFCHPSFVLGAFFLDINFFTQTIFTVIFALFHYPVQQISSFWELTVEPPLMFMVHLITR